MSIAPKTEPMGRIPISIDWAANELMVIPYTETRVAMGTDVIYLRL